MSELHEDIPDFSGLLYPDWMFTVVNIMVMLRQGHFLGEKGTWMELRFPCCWESTYPTPMVEASTLTMKVGLGSGWTKNGAVPKASLRFWKTPVADASQDKDLGRFFCSNVKGEAILL